MFRYGWAPSGLSTVRQLAARGLRPGGQDVAGWLVWGPGNRPRWAYLYRTDLARPKRAMTPPRWRAVTAMNTAQQVCPKCGRDVGYRISRRERCCWDCAPNPWAAFDDVATTVADVASHGGRVAA